MSTFNIANPRSFMSAQVMETLRLVTDPELQVNIIDLGLVYHADVKEEEKLIRITMTLSSPHCPMGKAIINSVENCLETHFTNYKAEVNLVWEPVWSYENITAEGKKQLGI